MLNFHMQWICTICSLQVKYMKYANKEWKTAFMQKLKFMWGKWNCRWSFFFKYFPWLSSIFNEKPYLLITWTSLWKSVIKEIQLLPLSSKSLKEQEGLSDSHPGWEPPVSPTLTNATTASRGQSWGKRATSPWEAFRRALYLAFFSWEDWSGRFSQHYLTTP